MPLPAPGAELAALMILAWAAFVSIPLALGSIGLSWDALNHHVYLGWIAEHPRFERDYLAASFQSFQYPYLYWPFYKLFMSGMPGRWAGALLVTLNIAAVPPLWMLARRFVPDRDWYGLALRWLAVALAFTSGLTLSMFDTSANDLLAAIPLVWALAFAIEAREAPSHGRWSVRHLLLLSGFFAGAAVAFKLSNGPLAILMPLLWLVPGRSWLDRALDVLCACAATLVGVLLLYGPWGWQLWSHYGNPVYPFYDNYFDALRAATGWRP
ncbi:MAG: hypothetical protein V4787_16400 [Pseudomonadota bacterium]